MRTIVIRRSLASAAAINSIGLESFRRGVGTEVLASAAMDTDVSVEDLSDNERSDLDRRPEFVTADPMPLTLIKPFESADEPAAGTAGAYDPYVVNDAQNRGMAWGIEAVGAAASQFTGRDVPVAVLDTGIDKQHPAFADPQLNIVERNFTSAPDGDLDGHGTHCAGTIFGRDVDGVRIGVARGVTKAFIAKVIPGDLGALLDALKWASDSGVCVASMSLGYDFPGWVEKLTQRHGVPQPAAVSMALQDYRKNMAAFDALMDQFRARSIGAQGMVVVAATGNEAVRKPQPPGKPYTIDMSPPAAAFGIIGVAAVQRAANGLEVADFSNTSPRLCAPGVDVLSARAGGQDLVAFSGTSMATPHVAGLAALYWDQALHQSGGRQSAETIASRLMGRARTGSLAPGFSAVDVGDGLAVAP